MPTATSRSVRRDGAELLELPNGVGFGEGVELSLVRSGDVLTVTPARPRPVEVEGETSMHRLVRELEKLPKPSFVEVRDTEIIPEREGL